MTHRSTVPGSGLGGQGLNDGSGVVAQTLLTELTELTVYSRVSAPGSMEVEAVLQSCASLRSQLMLHMEEAEHCRSTLDESVEHLVNQMCSLMTPSSTYQSNQDSQSSHDTQHSEPVIMQSAMDAACAVQQGLKALSIQISKSTKACIQLNKEVESVAQAVRNVQIKLQDYEYLAEIRDYIASIRKTGIRALRREGWDVFEWWDVVRGLRAEEEPGSDQGFTQATRAAAQNLGLSWLDLQHLREVADIADGMMHLGGQGNIDDALHQLDKKLPPRLSHTVGAPTCPHLPQECSCAARSQVLLSVPDSRTRMLSIAQ